MTEYFFLIDIEQILSKIAQESGKFKTKTQSENQIWIEVSNCLQTGQVSWNLQKIKQKILIFYIINLNFDQMKVIFMSRGFKDELEVWSSRNDSDADQRSNHKEADTRLILHAIVSN